MKTKNQVIDETVKYYTANPRAVNKSGSCRYITNDGKRCAVSRCMLMSAVKEVVGGDIMPLNPTAKALMTNNVICIHWEWSMLKKAYRHIQDAEFWQDIQRLHDGEEYWSEKGGLSLTGVHHVGKLKKEYA